MHVNYAESETQQVGKMWSQDSGIEKNKRNSSSIADKKTTSSTRERPAQTSGCCFGSLRSLSVHVVATRAVSMRLLGGWYIRDRFVLAFYVSCTVFGWKVDCKRCNRCDTWGVVRGLGILTGEGVSLPAGNVVTGVDGRLLGGLGVLMG
jgi:hypothetical protein